MSEQTITPMPSRPAGRAQISRIVQAHRDPDSGNIGTIQIAGLVTELKHHLDAVVEQGMAWGIQEGKRQAAENTTLADEHTANGEPLPGTPQD